MPSHRDTAREFPWDRIPTAAGFEFYNAAFGLIAPNWTNVATYTVPAGRKGAIDGATGTLILTAVGGAGSLVFMRIAVTSGGSVYPIIAVVMDGNVVGTRLNANTGQAGWMQPGDVLTVDIRATLGGPIVGAYAGAKVAECQA